MRPPICAFCGKDFRDSPEAGGLLSFLRTPEERNFNEKMARQGMVGHPRGKAWFCGDHFAAAQALSAHCTLGEALRRLRTTPDSALP